MHWWQVGDSLDDLAALRQIEGEVVVVPTERMPSKAGVIVAPQALIGELIEPGLIFEPLRELTDV